MPSLDFSQKKCDWVSVFLTHRDIFFYHLVDFDDSITPLKLPVGGYIKYKGGDVLKLALTCTWVFSDFAPLIEKILIFRSQFEEAFKIYSPRRLIVLEQRAVRNIPSEATHLYCGPNLVLNPLPSSVTHIVADDVDTLVFPPRLTHLTCTDSSRTLCRRKLPNTLKYLKYDGHHLPDLPPSLTHLDVTYCCVFPPQFPPSLTHLTLNRISHALPPFPAGLTHLEAIYCQTTFPQFPPSLLHFKLVNEHIFRDIPPLPPALEDLLVDSTYFQTNAFPSLPRNLKCLTLPSKYRQPLQEVPSLITHLKHVYLSPNKPLPNTLRSLQLPNDFVDPLPPLPPYLTHLIFPLRYNHPIPQLPSTLTHLQVGFNLPSTQHLPALTHLTIKYDNHPPYQSIKLTSFPPSVTHLTLDITNDAKTYIPALPPNLVCLMHYGTAAISSFPATLRSLTCTSYEFPLPPLPSSLTYLSVGSKHTCPLPALPPSLERLELATYRPNCPFPLLPASLQFLSLPLTMAPPPSVTSAKSSPFSSNLLWLECGLDWFREWQVSSLVPDKCHVKLIPSMVF